MQEFSLEAIGQIFLGLRLGALSGSEDGRALIELTVKVFELGYLLATTPPQQLQDRELIRCNNSLKLRIQNFLGLNLPDILRVVLLKSFVSGWDGMSGKRGLAS